MSGRTVAKYSAARAPIAAPGHLAQLTAHKFEGDPLCLSEFDCNVQGMGNNDAVAAGLEAKVF